MNYSILLFFIAGLIIGYWELKSINKKWLKLFIKLLTIIIIPFIFYRAGSISGSSDEYSSWEGLFVSIWIISGLLGLVIFSIGKYIAVKVKK